MHARYWSLLVVMVAGLLAAAPLQAGTERYNIDQDHTIVGFKVAHMVVSKTTGRFTDYTGFIEMDPDAKTVKAIEADIKTASVSTNHEKRDIHLKSPDFF
ncbi:MAG: polyisoprenoid-binding protein, partial [Nitrospira sp.]|nr:polyisoprenoid-binding protein [Nitrospira sp.]